MVQGYCPIRRTSMIKLKELKILILEIITIISGCIMLWCWLFVLGNILFLKFWIVLHNILYMFIAVIIMLICDYILGRLKFYYRK